jgi:phage gp29-like protein
MNNQGLWVSPTQFVSFAEAKRGRSLSRHVATRSRTDGAAFGGLSLPNPDPILKAQGKDIAAYRDLRSAARVGGNIRRRKSSVLSLERDLKRGDAPLRVERFIRDWLAGLDLDRIIRELLDAPLFGYQPMELMWQPLGLYQVPEDLLGKPAEWFFYDKLNALRFRAQDAGMDGEPCDPQRFVVARQDATYANPYGFPDLSMCFWPTVFMKGGLKFWVQFTEKYGSPWVIGKHPRGATDAETDLLLDSLEAMVQDAVAAIPDDASVDIVEAAGKANSATVYRELLEYCRSEINVAMLGQDQTTEKDSNRASATAGAEVTKDIRDSDAAIVAAALNATIRRVVDLNFGPSVAAPIYQLWEQEQIDKVLADRDKSLSDAGVRFTPQYWARTYNLKPDDLASDTAPLAKTQDFSESTLQPVLDQFALDQAVANLPVEQLHAHIQQPLAAVIEALQHGSTEEHALAAIADVYPKMDDQALQHTLTRLMFSAGLWGRLNASADQED